MNQEWGFNSGFPRPMPSASPSAFGPPRRATDMGQPMHPSSNRIATNSSASAWDLSGPAQQFPMQHNRAMTMQVFQSFLFFFTRTGIA